MAIRGLYAIADHNWNPCDSLNKLVRCYLDAGVRLVQLRMKRPADADDAWEATVAEEARAIAELKERYQFTFIVNDYIDAAIAVDADGVHVGEHDMPVAEVKKRLPEGMIVGYSSHSVDEACAAADAGVDYVAFGAVFPTKTKGPGHPVQGIARLKELVSSVDVPVVAIGGITRENAEEVIATGASAVAMITGLSQAPSIDDEVRWYLDKLE